MKKIPFTFCCALISEREVDKSCMIHTLFLHVVVGGSVYKIQGGTRSINYEKKIERIV